MPSTKRAQLFCSGERETPRRKAVASYESLRVFFLAASVRLHGARPWHLTSFYDSFCSGEREAPRHEAVGILIRVFMLFLPFAVLKNY